jgi:hypothetical protein
LTGEHSWRTRLGQKSCKALSLKALLLGDRELAALTGQADACEVLVTLGEAYGSTHHDLVACGPGSGHQVPQRT